MRRFRDGRKRLAVEPARADSSGEPECHRAAHGLPGSQNSHSMVGAPVHPVDAVRQVAHRFDAEEIVVGWCVDNEMTKRLVSLDAQAKATGRPFDACLAVPAGEAIVE